MILEGLLTTINDDGSVNIAPMGPVVESTFRSLVFRPYQTAQSFANLQRTREAVFHVVDRVALLAQAAIGKITTPPAMHRATSVDGWILDEACRWYAVRVRAIDDSRPRAEMPCDIVESGVQREYFGLNRARHAVLEAAILATRVHLLPLDEIWREFARLRIVVAKTGEAEEQAAFALLEQHVQSSAPRLDLVDMTG